MRSPSAVCRGKALGGGVGSGLGLCMAAGRAKD